MRILLITPTSNQVIGFRAKLIETLQTNHCDVSVITFDDKYKAEIKSKGIKFYSIQDSNRSLNPMKLLTLKDRIAKLIKTIQPDTVMTFMLKPNIYGTLAAHKVGIKNIFCMVEGAGDVFINNGFKWKIIRKYVCYKYKQAFRYAKKVIFLNHDDKAEFIQRKLVKPEQCEVIHGIGVDLEKFAYKSINNHNVFLMVARMLRTKGVMEYCQAARIVKQKYPNAIFNYLGGEGTIKISDIQEFIDDGSINYLGTTNDVRPYYEDCAAYVLPTYREGFPVSVMEAEATGRMAIVSNTNGCRDAVIDGDTGIFATTKNVDDLAEKLIWCMEYPDEVEQMGKNARRFAEENFDETKINECIYKIAQGARV